MILSPPIKFRARACLSILLTTFFISAAQAQSPRWLDPDLDLQNLPSSGSSLADGGMDRQIIRFRNWAQLYPTREIRSGSYTLNLPRNEQDFSDIRYSVGSQSYSLDDYMRRNHVGGLLVIKDGEIKLERYGLGNNEDSLWVSFSMSKSATSLLLGAAIKDGYINSVDDKVTDYLPRLKGSSYDQTTLRNVLQMSSGVEWNEDYADPNSDVATYPSANIVSLYEFLGEKSRVADPGEVFHYNTGETDLVGAIVRAAIGNNLATYLENKIWIPYGMETTANWTLHGVGGGERGGCCINANLRDYGRLGMFAMAEGVLADGTQIIPENWMEESTTPSKGSAGYGYLWWLDESDSYNALGIFGQRIHINPSENLVVVTLSAWTTATGSEYSAHSNGLIGAISEATK